MERTVGDGGYLNPPAPPFPTSFGPWPGTAFGIAARIIELHGSRHRFRSPSAWDAVAKCRSALSVCMFVSHPPVGNRDAWFPPLRRVKYSCSLPQCCVSATQREKPPSYQGGKKRRRKKNAVVEVQGPATSPYPRMIFIILFFFLLFFRARSETPTSESPSSCHNQPQSPGGHAMRDQRG
ncbi:uncharacterized protein LY79DRAFT_261676 [Colletotrichum navitas]|uniref:Uncharacterized protein n=1 Tax=Colletotrichum navitas TaxID=681940 RepID=A0AAD8V1Y1_9PEZI|nr:uncharacterized protein LY79DRAFT_261676 [Colletotrichum navitas]KAK1585831.1 hypothetical protein LY79DRAFT_261676 [Colletotrichum navitas]